MDTSPAPTHLALGISKATNKTNGNVQNNPSRKIGSEDAKAIMKMQFDHYIEPVIQEMKPEKIVVLGETFSKIR